MTTCYPLFLQDASATLKRHSHCAALRSTTARRVNAALDPAVRRRAVTHFQELPGVPHTLAKTAKFDTMLAATFSTFLL